MNEPKMIVVRGKPAPQGSKVSTRYGGIREASQLVMPWRNQIVSACIEQKINNGEIIEQPVEIFIDFLFHRPQGHYGSGRNEKNLKPSAPNYPTTYRDAVRTKCASIETAINDCSSLADFMKLFDRPSDDTNPPIYDFPDEV